MPAASAVRSFVILGITESGRQFRPSDWAERLAGVMAGFRPPGAASVHARLGYSPYVMPGIRDGVRSVRVDARLHEIEPMAYDFLVRFAADNDLKIVPA
jgi:hypothetical protein